jgi:sugar lactone lactonase YvrE
MVHLSSRDSFITSGEGRPGAASLSRPGHASLLSTQQPPLSDATGMQAAMCTLRPRSSCVNLKRIPLLTFMVQALAAVLLVILPSVLRGQSVTFSYAQSTVPASGLSGVFGVAVDGSGNLFIPSYSTNQVVKVAVGTGVQTTVPAVNLNGPRGVAVDGSGNVFIADSNNNRVVKVTPGGDQTIVGNGLYLPGGVAVDGSGNVFIADTGNNRVVKVPPAGAQTIVGNGLSLPGGVAVDGAGNVFIADTNNSRVVKVTPAGIQSIVPADVSNPWAVAVDGSGNVFIADLGNNRVVKVTPDGNQSTVPGDLYLPQGVAVDGAGNVFVPTEGIGQVSEVNTVSVNFPALNVCAAGQTTPTPCSQTITLNYNVTASGTLRTPIVVTQGAQNLDFTLAGGSTCTSAVTAGSTCTVNVTFAPRFAGLRTGAVRIVDASGNVLATTLVYGIGQGPQIGFDPAPQTTVGKGLTPQSGVAVDGSGNVFIVNNNTVVKVAPNGNQTTYVANDLTNPQGLAVDGSGTLYIADYGGNRVVTIAPNGFRNNANASFLNGPAGLSVDGWGNLFIADYNNGRVVEVPAGCAASSCQTTVGAGLNVPADVAVDGAGNVFIADVGNQNVVKVPSGCKASSCQTTVGTGLSKPDAVAVDGAGNVFISDAGYNDVVEVPADGSPQFTYATGLGQPAAVKVDRAGNVFIVDPGNNRVLELQRSQPPTLSFAATLIGETSSDSPKSVTVQNTGNQSLTAIAPGLSIGANFMQVKGPGTPEDCTSSFSLAAGASCNLSISFTPTAVGTITSSAVLTDNALNANPATQSIKLTGTGTQEAPTLSFSVPNQTYGVEPFAVNATSNSPGAITYSVVSGPATISGNIVTITGVGSVTLQASQAATGKYAAATARASFTVSQATPTLSFSVPNQTYGTAPFRVSATSNSSGAITYSVVSGPATISSNIVTITGVGSVTLQASQAETTNYTAATTKATFTVNKATPTLTFSVPNQTYGAAPFAVNATSNSPGAITYSVVSGPATISGNIVTITGAGSVTLQASQAETTNYTAATTRVTFTVNKATPTLTFTPIPNQTYGVAPFTVSATSNSPGAITFSVVSGPASVSGNRVEISGAGSVTLQASLAATGNYLGATVQTTFTVNKATPTLAFMYIPAQTYGVAPFAVSARSNSPGTITYSVVSGPATISGNIVTITGVGTVILQASQAETANYTAATTQITFEVYQAYPTINFSVPNQTYGTAPFAINATSNSTGAITYAVISGTGSATISGNIVTITGLGPVIIQATQAPDPNFLPGSAQASFTVFSQSQTTIASLTSTTATIDVFGFGFTAPSGQLAFTDVTSGSPVAAPVTLDTSTATTALTPQTTTSTGANTLPVWTMLGDINGDGKLDLVTSLYLTDSVSIQLGNGDGTFQAATTILIAAGFGPAECHLVSLRGNGTLDLIVGSFNINQIAVLLGNGNGTFENPVFYTVGTSNNTPTSLTTGDFNDDGNLDVAVANTGDDTVSVLLGNGSGGLTPLGAPINVGRTPQAIRAGDFNGDGYSDLAVANYSDGTVTTLLNNQNGTFMANTISVGSGAGSGPQAMAIHGTGSSLLLAVANYKDNTVSVLTSKGDGTFGTQKIVAVGKGPDDVNFADFNGDGIEDLVVSNYADDTVDLLLGGASGNYALVGPFAVGDSPYSAAVGSLNVDGTPDIVVSNCFSNNTGVLLDGTQISVPYSGLSLIPGHTLRATYAPDGASKYGSSMSADAIAPPTADSFTRIPRRVR